MTEDVPQQTPAEETAPATDTVTLTVVAPPWSTGIRLNLADGSTLMVTRKGTEAPADQAQALIHTAATYGVTLRSN